MRGAGHEQRLDLELAGKIDKQMPYLCLEKIDRALNDHAEAVRGSLIVVVGVDYKPGVGDMRESPALKIIDLLRERGAGLSYHDLHVPELTEQVSAATIWTRCWTRPTWR